MKKARRSSSASAWRPDTCDGSGIGPPWWESAVRAEGPPSPTRAHGVSPDTD